MGRRAGEIDITGDVHRTKGGVEVPVLDAIGEKFKIFKS